MECYKCTSPFNLSIKRRNPSGSTSYICRPCRRMEYKSRKPEQESHPTTTPIKRNAQEIEEWNKRAKESELRILKRFNNVTI